MKQDRSSIPHDNWVQPISQFTATRQNLPHLQAPGSWYWIESNTWNGLVLSEEQRDLIFETIRHHAGKKYDLVAVVVMPTHIHLIIHPLEKNTKGYYALAEIMHSIKSYPANRFGIRMWQDESYDHILRNEKDYLEKLRYLIMNPVVAGLVERPEDYKWLIYPGIQR